MVVLCLLGRLLQHPDDGVGLLLWIIVVVLSLVKLLCCVMIGGSLCDEAALVACCLLLVYGCCCGLYAISYSNVMVLRPLFSSTNSYFW